MSVEACSYSFFSLVHSLADYFVYLQYCAKVMIANFVEFRRSSTKFYVNLRNFEENEFSAKFRADVPNFTWQIR